MNRWQRPELYRHPAVPALAILAHMADGGKGQVHAGHQEFAVRRVTLNQTTALLAPKVPTEHCQYLKDRMEMTFREESKYSQLMRAFRITAVLK